MNQINPGKHLSYLETGGKASLNNSGFWRLLVLIMMSLLLSNLCVSFVALIFVSPVPLVIASLVYGKKIALSLALVLSSILIGVAGYIEPSMVYIAMAFIMTTILAVTTTFAIEKQIKPYRAITTLGVTISALVWGAFLYTTQIARVDLQKMILEKLQEAQGMIQTSQELGLEEIVSQLYASLPIIFTFVPFLGAWLFILLIINNKTNWARYQSYSYGMSELMRFRTPFAMVYALVIGMGLGLAGHQLKIDELWTASMVVINLLGAFYFFQGFGIFWETLGRFKIKGFFRTLLIFIVIIWAMMWVALIGLFDTWLDFRKILENRTEGE